MECGIDWHLNLYITQILVDISLSAFLWVSSVHGKTFKESVSYGPCFIKGFWQRVQAKTLISFDIQQIDTDNDTVKQWSNLSKSKHAKIAL